jgi:hypothetical protein
MTGLIWPHQPKPRHVGTMVDVQVQSWTLKQDESKDTSRADVQIESSGPLDIPDALVKRKVSEILGFGYWECAIVAELARLMNIEEKTAAAILDKHKRGEH